MREVWLEGRFSLGNEVRMARTNLSRNPLNFQALRSSDGFWRSTARYEGRIYNSNQRYGLAWIQPEGHLRWRDLWRSAEESLGEITQSGSDEFERTLAQQFLQYWRSMPKMWKYEGAGKDWAELLPPDYKPPDGQPCGFDELWDEVRSFARERLGCNAIVPYLGYSLQIEFTPDACPEADQISVSPIVDVADYDNWDDRLGPHVLSLLFRPRDNRRWPEVPSEALFDNKWPARFVIRRVGPIRQLEILVGIQDWTQETTQRRKAVASAFGAGVKLAAAESGVRFQGLE